MAIGATWAATDQPLEDQVSAHLRLNHELTKGIVSDSLVRASALGLSQSEQKI
jgi:hypothetical protein